MKKLVWILLVALFGCEAKHAPVPEADSSATHRTQFITTDISGGYRRQLITVEHGGHKYVVLVSANSAPVGGILHSPDCGCGKP